MNLSKKLWDNNNDLALHCLNTKFVQGIKNGNLLKKNFQEYVAQDYFFLESFARAYGLAINKAIDKYSIKVLSELVVGISKELILHENYANSWEINLNKNFINPSTEKYTDFLKDISLKGSCVEIISAMTPCMRLYSWLGQNLSKAALNNPYKDWINTYSDKSFEKLTQSLENLIDNYANPVDVYKLENLYRRAMELELDFFNAHA